MSAPGGDGPRPERQAPPLATTTMTSVGSAGVRDRGVAVVGVVSAPPAPAGAGTSVQRRRPREVIAVGEVTRGAPPEVLMSPAGEVLGAMPWSGASPDPDVLDAVTFLAWL